jgi:hypothetical protein
MSGSSVERTGAARETRDVSEVIREQDVVSFAGCWKNVAFDVG